MLGQYTFLPWVRGGIGAVVAGARPRQLRATIAVAVPVQADGPAGPDRVPPTVAGARTGRRHRPRRAPGHPALPAARRRINVEDSFLAHVEFDRPECRGCSAPAAPAGDQADAVAGAGRAGRRAATSCSPGEAACPARCETSSASCSRSRRVGLGARPADRAGRQRRPARRRPADPVVRRRRTCPGCSARAASQPDTQYLACVVPLRRGCRPALGAAAAGRARHRPGPAPRRPDDDDADHPAGLYVVAVQHRCRRRLRVAGREAARRAGALAGRAAAHRDVAARRRPARPRRRRSGRAADRSTGRWSARSCPTRPAPTRPRSAAVAAENATWPASETEALRTLLNRPDELAGTTPPAVRPPDPRPVVGPEIYARYQAAASRVDATRDGDWFGQLNLRPEHRVQAGLGTRVVQMDQEQLMQSAWAQVGDDRRRQPRSCAGPSWPASSATVAARPAHRPAGLRRPAGRDPAGPVPRARPPQG